MLNLTRPLVCFDIEATGMNLQKDRIVELALIKIYPLTKEQKQNGEEQKREEYVLRFNPELTMSDEVIAIHHITNEMVKNEPTFKQQAHRIVEILSGADLCGYNSNHFDIPLLAEELARAGIDYDLHKVNFIDVQNIFYKMEQRTLSAASIFYLNKEMQNAHSALSDADTTLNVLQAQIDRYNTLQNDVKWLSEFTCMKKNADFAGRIYFNENNKEVFAFGQYKGELVENVFRQHPQYYNWIMNGDFSSDTKCVCTQIKLRLK